ncbi:abortive phage infection protein [Actinomadura sp. WAC 06369]|uniref:abortive phage infection protein n=1 Tax=Actinomadura sp. WAC 06369 TaxID=2203193 RepID=UPI000F79A923|nr:abortive phage infection protein [Actinomadura sp. WAC 06369]RSN71310.1 abortive phage infection protein [Actinomadura sp. WAC 06369]
MSNEHAGRRRFLAGAGALGAAAVAGRAGIALAGTGEAAPSGGRRGLRHRGVCYAVEDGETPETGWDAARMRADLRVIAGDLHASTVSVFGDGVRRLTATAEEAADRGLHVWLQPRLADRPHEEILDHLAETGRAAERMRRQGARVHLSVGCEFLLFVPGIVPGESALERIENIMSGNYDPAETAERLREFIARAAATGRSVFRGALTYGAASDEADESVDWGLFDLVSVNYYGYHSGRTGYVRDLRRYRRFGKPVAITECGTCTFEGAPEHGGMGWDIVDYDKPRPEITADVRRSERAQAAYLGDVFDAFESMGLYSATIYNFVAPDSPHRPQRRFDLDLASYSLVKPIWESPERPGNWHWEPKEAFHAMARRFARAGGADGRQPGAGGAGGTP